MKRSGFTMIELVFVIVILGILASVAIPKLAATRDDANIAKASSEISSLIQDLGSYYTAHGQFDSNISKMTNVSLGDDDNNASNGVTYDDPSRTGHHCLKFTYENGDGNLTVSNENDSSSFCKGLTSAVSDLIGTHTFGGSSIYN